MFQSSSNLSLICMVRNLFDISTECVLPSVFRYYIQMLLNANLFSCTIHGVKPHALATRLGETGRPHYHHPDKVLLQCSQPIYVVRDFATIRYPLILIILAA